MGLISRGRLGGAIICCFLGTVGAMSHCLGGVADGARSPLQRAIDGGRVRVNPPMRQCLGNGGHALHLGGELAKRVFWKGVRFLFFLNSVGNWGSHPAAGGPKQSNLFSVLPNAPS